MPITSNTNAQNAQENSKLFLEWSNTGKKYMDMDCSNLSDKYVILIKSLNKLILRNLMKWVLFLMTHLIEVERFLSRNIPVAKIM